jgi:hypothetical protein
VIRRRMRSKPPLMSWEVGRNAGRQLDFHLEGS